MGLQFGFKIEFAGTPQAFERVFVDMNGQMNRKNSCAIDALA